MSKEKLELFPEMGVIPTFVFYVILYSAMKWLLRWSESQHGQSYRSDHINNSIDPTFAERLFSLQQITNLLHLALADYTDEQERRAVVAFAIHGSYKLLCDWINDPRRISPELQTERILRLARRVCGDSTISIT